MAPVIDIQPRYLLRTGGWFVAIFMGDPQEIIPQESLTDD
jgi:hypothetical protein